MWRKFTQYNLFLLAAILVSSTLACAGKPAPVLQWSKTFGNGEDDYGNSVQQTKDDGYIICGDVLSDSAKGSHILLLKLSVRK